MQRDEIKSAEVYRYLTLALAAFLVPALLRVALIIEKGVSFGAPDLRGLTSDMGAALFFSAIVAYCFRFGRLVPTALLIVWALTNYGVYEHIITLDAMPSYSNLKYLLDPTFLTGSAFSTGSPLLFIAVIIIALFTGLFIISKDKLHFRAYSFLIAGIASLIILAVWTPEFSTLQWRQKHAALSNAAMIFQGSTNDTRTAARARLPLADFTGKPIIKLDNKKQNVLLVMLESVSGAYLDSVAAPHNVNAVIKMPRLNELAKSNLAYANFITNQRQTNRGEYAILCGDYPKLDSSEPKMSVFARKDKTNACLPELLKRSGYETVYLQAAPMGFMLKDRFMPNIGFESSYGDDYFTEWEERAKWGVDDRAFFNGATEMIRSLQEKQKKNGKPWFLATLTVGTHDPYIVPKSHASPFDKSSLGHAVSFLDDAFGDFIEKLKKEGLLENTILIITSDESAGIAYGSDDFLRTISQNWGFLVVIFPDEADNKGRLIEERFSQIDIAASVLDYLGLQKKARGLTGRSVFRSYKKKRPHFFANSYQHITGALDTNERLYLCKENFSVCKSYTLTGGAPFSPGPVVENHAGADETEFIHETMALTSRTDKRKEEHTIELALLREVALVSGLEQLIFGGQEFSLPGGGSVEMTLEVELLGNEGHAVLVHDLVGKAQTGGGLIVLNQTVLPPLSAGDKLTLSYRYQTGDPLVEINSLLHSRKLGSEELRLKITKAALRFSPAGSEQIKSPLKELKEASFNGQNYGATKLGKLTIKRFNEIIRLSPENAAAHAYLGVYHLMHGDIDKGRASFTAAAKHGKDDPEIHAILAEGFFTANMPGEASFHMEMVKKLRNRQ